MSDLFNLQDDAPVRRSLLTLVLLLIVVPFVQAGSQILPLQLTNIQWRFGAANALSSVLMLPFVGLTLLLVMSRMLESRGMSRTVGIVAAIFTLGLMASLGLFALDAMQLKAIVNSRMMDAFETTTVRVGAVSGLFCLAFAVLTLSAFQSPASRLVGRTKGDKRAEEGGVGLIVGQ